MDDHDPLDKGKKNIRDGSPLQIKEQIATTQEENLRLPRKAAGTGAMTINRGSWDSPPGPGGGFHPVKSGRSSNRIQQTGLVPPLQEQGTVPPEPGGIPQ